MRYLKKYTGLLIAIILTACTVTKTICPCEAPEIIRLGNKEIEINAQVSLIDTTTSGKMKIKIWLTALDHTTLPANFKADYYYLRSSNLARAAFEGKFSDTSTDSIKGIMELEAFDAPHCEQTELVDIAVHLVDSHGKTHFLKKGALPIQPANR
jgi:hypothetical protein